MKVIVSRYNEDVSWTEQLSNVIIFNKVEPDIESKHPIIQLENLGREGHTFYNYFYENYDNLDDYTICLQGDPFDHCKNAVELVKQYQDGSGVEQGFAVMADLRYDTTLGNDIMMDDNMNQSKIPIHLVYNYILDVYQIQNIGWTFGVGGQFIVSKENVLNRPRIVYEKISNILKRTKSPIEGYVMERLHLPVLCPQKNRYAEN